MILAKGIISTVLNSGKFNDNGEKSKAVYWALEDGNSSQGTSSNHGLGFSIIKKFVDKKNGLLTIRTDQFTFNYKNGKLKMLTNECFFPGTQIVIYTPLNIK